MKRDKSAKAPGAKLRRRPRPEATEPIRGDRPELPENETAVPVSPERPASSIHEGTYRIAAGLVAIAVTVFFFVRGAPKPMLIAASVVVIAIICLHVYERSRDR